MNLTAGNPLIEIPGRLTSKNQPFNVTRL